MTRLLVILLLLTLPFTLTFAQKKLPKFGKIDPANLAMTHYPTDSSAKAAFLFDKAFAEMEYQSGPGTWSISFERHLRIKILDKSAIDWADFSISLYNDRSDREKIGDFKAITHTLVNGKAQEMKVGKKDLITEVKSDNWSVAKIAMPNVQEGSIIEIKYTVRSPFVWNLWDWQFQYGIPVRYSEYQVNYPEWFQYSTKFKGYDLQYIEALQINPDQRSIDLSYTERSGDMVVKSRRVQNKVDYQRLRFGWIAQEMPAFVPEAYISNKNNFLVKVDFELSGTSFPNSPWKSFTRDWVDLNKTMLESGGFGDQLAKGKIKFLVNETNALTNSLADEKDKIAAIYYHIKNKMAWDGKQTKYVEKSLKSAYEQGKGNTADINLNLLAMLRQADITAHPVLLSTRNHGFLNPVFPALSQFNYVIVGVTLKDGKMLLLDATDKNLPLHLLPTRCINDRGLIVKEGQANWVNLLPNGKYNIVRSFDLKLNDNKEWEGTMNVRCKDYAANNMRQKYHKEDEATYIAAVESDYEGLNVHKFSAEGLEKIGKGVKESCEVSFHNQLMDGGDLLYFNPMLTFGYEENPFKLAERTYPIDYSYPLSTVYSAKFEIPDGYAVEELPEKMVISLPEKSGMFSYSAKMQGNQVIILSQFKINKHLFLPTEYGVLKRFYNLMVEKHLEQVVLKKV